MANINERTESHEIVFCKIILYGEEGTDHRRQHLHLHQTGKDDQNHLLRKILNRMKEWHL
jgi:hypothetical protein